MQVKGWANEFQAEGLFCIWLGHRPLVVITKPEYVEVQCGLNIEGFLVENAECKLLFNFRPNHDIIGPLAGLVLAALRLRWNILI